jgi:glutaconyl-CoA/methylmalonyl-CoA decarboxylase subunit gamma
MPVLNTYTVTILDRTYTITIDGDLISFDGQGAGYQIDCRKIGDNRYSLFLNGRSYTLNLEEIQNGIFTVNINGKEFRAIVEDERSKRLSEFTRTSENKDSGMIVYAPMPGLVIEIAVHEGEGVHEGKGLLVLEAMKMENEIQSQIKGIIEKIHVIPGQTVEKETPLLTIS